MIKLLVPDELLFLFVFYTIFKYIGDITCPRVDMDFTFECSTRYLTSERSERVRYRVEQEKIKIRIHKQACNILFII